MVVQQGAIIINIQCGTMAGNNFGLNIATQKGDGAADVMQWGNLDRATNQIYQEQKQREARGYQDYLQGQQSLQKEFANVRSADIPDVVNSYNNLKKIKQDILFNPKIQNDAVALAKRTQESQIAEAQLRQQIAASQETKKNDESINARMLSHPDDFTENAGQLHTQHMNLPLSERIKIGALGDSPYAYQGTNTDFGKLSKTAQGTLKTTPFGEETPTADQYSLEQKQISRFNNPVQYAQNMYGSLQKARAGQDAAKLLNQMSPQQVSQIQSSFNAIPDQEFEQKWGIKKQDLINGVLPDDKAGNYVLLDAMKYATMNMPQAAASKFRPNSSYIANQKEMAGFNDWLLKNGITSGQVDARMVKRFQHENELQNSSSNAIPTIFKGYQTGQTFEGKEGENIEVLNIPPIVAKDLSKNKDASFGRGSDGKIYEIQFQKGDDGKMTKKPDWTKSKEVPESEVITAIQNHSVPSNQKAKTLLNTLGNKLGITGKPKIGTVSFEDGGITYDIPADKVDAFIKAKPKAKRK